MSFVKWNGSKYHVLNQYGHRSLMISNGRVSSPRSDDGLATTDCGQKILSENQYFDQLPPDINRQVDVCHKCDHGVGVAKIDRIAEKQHSDKEGREALKRFNDRRHKAAMDMFGY